MPATVQQRYAHNELTALVSDLVQTASMTAGASIVRPLEIAPDDWQIGALFFKFALYPVSVFQSGNIAHFTFYAGLCAGSSKRVGQAGDVFAGSVFDDTTLTAITHANTVPPNTNYAASATQYSIVRLSGAKSTGGGLASVQIPLNDAAWTGIPSFGNSWMPMYILFMKGDPNITIHRSSGYGAAVNPPRGVIQNAIQDYFSSTAIINTVDRFYDSIFGAGSWFSYASAAIAMSPVLQGALTHVNFYWTNTTEVVNSRMLIRDVHFVKWK